MSGRVAAYWASTAITAFVFFSGGVVALLHVEGAVRGFAALGYPAHFVTFLGAAKLLGAIAILAPRFPRLKEWAYAGMAFDLIGAAVAHAAVRDPAAKVVAPLVFLSVALSSWALRPSSRKLPSASNESKEETTTLTTLEEATR